MFTVQQSSDQLAELDLDSDESSDDEENIFGFISVVNMTSKKVRDKLVTVYIIGMWGGSGGM